ncbi:glycoside hydrolase family 3 N-terminal domain-containing protein, partial [Rhizobium johnstonii]
MIFRDPTQSLSARARDLYDRLTDDERLAMLHQAAPAVERLGVAEFRTGCETLHGVAWLGTATVFPQPVGLAATWDTDLLLRIGEVVSTEVRAKKAADPLVSLNVWAPVVNTLRHPQWGRNEEGYSEDPHLTAHL